MSESPPSDTLPTETGGSTVQRPPEAARRADLAGLLMFLSWVHWHAAVFGRRPGTVAAYRSAWHVAYKRLGLPAVALVDELDLDTLAQQIASAGSPEAKSSARDYRDKLAIAGAGTNGGAPVKPTGGVTRAPHRPPRRHRRSFTGSRYAQACRSRSSCPPTCAAPRLTCCIRG